VSGLMIMGIAGGAVFPLLMGVVSDRLDSQSGAVIVVAVLVIYLGLLASRIKEKNG
jgi:fucose permease